jgi:hypothetical protein
MIKTVRVTKYNEIRVIDTFKPTIEKLNGGTPEADIHFGSNMDILIIVGHNKKISKDNLERIRILTDVKDS